MTAIENERINLNQLSSEQRKQLTRETYCKKSYFQHLFMCDWIEPNSSQVSMALRHEIERILLEKNLIPQAISLENLHEHLSDEMKTYNFNDGVNKITTEFYETDASFMNAYNQLIYLIRSTIIKEPFWFQSTPTIRIHCPNGKNSDHYPRYHTDIGYGHPPEEINFWLPLTNTSAGDHGFRVMSISESTQLLAEFDYDFPSFIDRAIQDKAFSAHCHTLSIPVLTPFGQILAFDSRCVHTGEPLKTHTRISIDIRILPLSQYQNMSIEYQGSGRRKIIFAPGQCYHEQNSDEYLSHKGMNV